MRLLCHDFIIPKTVVWNSNYVVSHVIVSFMVLRVSFRFHCTRGHGLGHVWDSETAHTLLFSTVVRFLFALISWSGV